MNYAAYMRIKAKSQPTVIGYQNGQDSSLQTHKVNARGMTVKTPSSVETTFSKPGGAIGNILEPIQQTNAPKAFECDTGYRGVASGIATANTTYNVMGAKENCAVCSDSLNPYSVVIHCADLGNGLTYIPPVQNAPGQTKCCQKDMSQLFRDNSELVADQGKQLTLRKRFNLPNKLQGLRGPIVTQ
jgi:hypothetical protein